MERTCLFFYVMLYLLFYFEAEKVKKDVKTSIYLIKMCYETCFFSWKVCQCPKSPYLCNVFFIVLDLRLTKVGVQRYSFFYAHTFRIFPLFPYKSTYSLGETPFIFLKTLFIQRLPDAQISPDDVVPLAAKHHQGRYAANAVL